METISVHELKAELRLEDSDFLIIDIREPYEFMEETIPLSQNMPIRELEESILRLKSYDKVFVSCRSGARSAVVASALRGVGINAINVSGGVLAWVEAGFDVEGSG